MDINELCTEAHENAVSKGFYDGNPSFGALLMQVVEELGEASDADRKGKRTKGAYAEVWNDWYSDNPKGKEYADMIKAYKTGIKDTVESELADAFIILAGICKSRNIDIDAHIQAKIRYNRTRERLHGKEY